MNNREAVNWLINILADIGKAEHSDLWHYEQALTEIKDILESAQPVATGTNVGDTISRQDAIDALDCINGVEEVLRSLPSVQPEPQWIPVSERLPSKEERKEWIDKNLGGIGYLYPCLVTRYSSINPDRTKNNPYVAKHYFNGEDFLNAGEEVCSEYIIAWMPLPEAYKPNK